MFGFEADLFRDALRWSKLSNLTRLGDETDVGLTARHPMRRRQPRHRQLRHWSGLVAMAGAQVHLGATYRDL